MVKPKNNTETPEASAATVGNEASRAKDELGCVYEYFLSQFASVEGKKGDEFYTPRCVVKLLIEMLEPYGGRVDDPCRGSSGMFVQSVEGEIRRSLIEADLVDCMVALPGQLFYATQIPACLWFLARDRKDGKFRDRRGHVLFIDARKLGRMVDRTHRELTYEDIARIAGTYHAWRLPAGKAGGETEAGEYKGVPGFCKSAALEEVRKHGHVLTPGRYVGAKAEGRRPALPAGRHGGRRPRHGQSGTRAVCTRSNARTAASTSATRKTWSGVLRITPKAKGRTGPNAIHRSVSRIGKRFNRTPWPLNGKGSSKVDRAVNG